MDELKRQYDSLLARENKAETYLDDNTIPYSERKKWIPQFRAILDEMSKILSRLPPSTSQERLNGFKTDQKASQGYFRYERGASHEYGGH